MREKLLFFSFILCCVVAMAQKDEDFNVKVKNPKLDALINKLWNDLPSDCSLPSYAIPDKGEEPCAGLALKHFKAIINNCKMTDAFADAIKAEFKLLKLIPAGKVAGTILDIADLTAKALSAKSPEQLAEDLAKYGFGKVVGDDVLKKLKKISGVPDDDLAADVLTSVTKYYYKKVLDEAKKALFPKPEKYDCHPHTKDCEDNIYFSIEPYEGDDPKVIAKVVFSADGDCHCRLACVPDGPEPHLSGWSVHGEVLLSIDKAEVITEGWFFKTKMLQVTLKAEQPTYHVQATCDDCVHGSNPYYKASNEIYAVASTIFEDSYSRFNTYGLNLSYLHPLSETMALTAEGSVHLGSNNGNDYTKYQLLAGGSLLPQSRNAKLSFSPHVLLGVSDIHSKFKIPSFTFSDNSTGFAMAAGTDVLFPFNNTVNLALRADYYPTFSGGIKNNFLLGVGFQFHAPAKKANKLPPVNPMPVFADLKLVNPGIIPIEEQFEVLTGECHDKSDADEPGAKTIIAAVNRNYNVKLLAPKNIGTCPIELFCIDKNDQKIPGTSVFLEPGEEIERYMSPDIPVTSPDGSITNRITRIVFECNSRKDGTCKLQLDHWDQNYHIPRGKIKGQCNNKNVLIGPSNSEPLNWIKNTGTCPIQVFTSDGKILDKPVTVAAGDILPVYYAARSENRGTENVYFKCPLNKSGSCEIELDSSVIHSFPMPKGHGVDIAVVNMVLKGDCDGQENTVGVTNGRSETYGFKNTGTCPIEIYEVDAEGNKSPGNEMAMENHNFKVQQRKTPMIIQPGMVADKSFISTDNFQKVMMKCGKTPNGNSCSLEVTGRTVEYLIPLNNPPKNKPAFKSLRSTITAECSSDPEDYRIISFLGGNYDHGIKWLTNTGDCTIELFSKLLSGTLSSKFRLKPGQSIEGYDAPKNTLAVYFRCLGGGNKCSLEYEHPTTHL